MKRAPQNRYLGTRAKPYDPIGFFELPTGTITVMPRQLEKLNDNPHLKDFAADLRLMNKIEARVKPSRSWSKKRRRTFNRTGR